MFGEETGGKCMCAKKTDKLIITDNPPEKEALSRLTPADKYGQKQTKTDKNGQMRTLTDKNGQCASPPSYLCIVIQKEPLYGAERGSLRCTKSIVRFVNNSPRREVHHGVHGVPQSFLFSGCSPTPPSFGHLP